jgi:hypothetical protein
VFDLTDVCFVKRIVVGSHDPQNMLGQQEIQDAIDTLNRCLSDLPRGRVLGIEKTFSILNIGEHQVVLQAMIYHVGFPRKPVWLQ